MINTYDNIYADCSVWVPNGSRFLNIKEIRRIGPRRSGQVRRVGTPRSSKHPWMVSMLRGLPKCMHHAGRIEPKHPPPVRNEDQGLRNRVPDMLGSDLPVRSPSSTQTCCTSPLGPRTIVQGSQCQWLVYHVPPGKFLGIHVEQTGLLGKGLVQHSTRYTLPAHLVRGSFSRRSCRR